MEFGSRINRVFASYFLLIITLFGSSFFSISLFLLYMETFSMNFVHLSFCVNFISEGRQSVIWVLLFLGLIVKIPLAPLHLWLPEAHTEASTVGSVILAGAVLKLGTYGIIRLLFVMYNSNLFFSNVVTILGAIGMFVASFISMVKIDIKKIVAYGSVMHMGFLIVGISECTSTVSRMGVLFVIVFHGVVSAVIFFMIGMIYERIATRNYYYLGSFSILAPLFSLN
jgi:NADH:ubiquinone oxidoreductase subunit 4 (subunit M)